MAEAEKIFLQVWMEEKAGKTKNRIESFRFRCLYCWDGSKGYDNNVVAFFHAVITVWNETLFPNHFEEDLKKI